MINLINISKSNSFSFLDKRKEESQTDKRPYQCKFCDKSFKQQDKLKRHERTHTGEKPYSCKHCSKSFTNSSGLKRHLLTHTGEKPYSCKFCSKQFISCTAVKRHELIHTGWCDDSYGISYCTSEGAWQARSLSADQPVLYHLWLASVDVRFESTTIFVVECQKLSKNDLNSR